MGLKMKNVNIIGLGQFARGLTKKREGVFEGGGGLYLNAHYDLILVHART